MPVVKPRTMPGVMELLPRDQVAFQRMLDRVRQSYERYGFLPIETPVMEFTDVLLTKSGGETEKQVYYAQSSGARAQGKEPELALRFDLTVPLARYVAEHQGELTFPFRRYQIQRVYRGESAQRGRYREFVQCDIDVIGRDHLSLLFDAEIPVVIHDTFRRLEIGAFTIQINNRKLLRGYLEGLGVGEEERQAAVLREVDKLDKKGADSVRRSLQGEAAGLSAEQAATLLDFLSFQGSHPETLGHLRAQTGTSALYQTGVAELAEVVEAAVDLGLPAERLRINLAIARGLDYYTGTIYETVLDEHPELGSVCSGGRYDNLAGHYTSTLLPGVGISLGATRLFYQLRELGLVGRGRGLIDVLVAQFDPALTREMRRLASTLRAAGLNTELFAEPVKMARQMKYAHRAGIPVVVLVGEDEHARGAALIKDMVRGEQTEVRLGDLIPAVRRTLAEDSAPAGSSS